jgi:hypothetical protein
MKSVFVGNKAHPSFLVEINSAKKVLTLYAPDQYSKDEEFYEKYSLGKVILQTTYRDVIFLQKPITYKNNLYVPEMILDLKTKHIMISTKASQLLTM